MAFRVRSISSNGGTGSAVEIAGYPITGTSQVFLGEHDDELGFGVPPEELVESAGIVLETLAGPPWPGSHADVTGLDAGKAAMLHAFRAGTWPSEEELVLQANVGAKHDPKTRPAILRQHFLRQGMTPAEADKAVERDKKPHERRGLLDGVKPIESRRRPTRALPAAPKAGKGARTARAAREADTAAEPTKPPTPAEAQAQREADAAAREAPPAPARAAREPKPKAAPKGGGRGR